MRLVSQIMGWLLFSSLIQFYRCIIKHLKEHKTVLYWVFVDRNDVRSLKLSQRILALRLVFSIQFKGSDVISVLKNSIEYNFVFFKCLIISQMVLYPQVTSESDSSSVVPVVLPCFTTWRESRISTVNPRKVRCSWCIYSQHPLLWRPNNSNILQFEQIF